MEPQALHKVLFDENKFPIARSFSRVTERLEAGRSRPEQDFVSLSNLRMVVIVRKLKH